MRREAMPTEMSPSLTRVDRKRRRTRVGALSKSANKKAGRPNQQSLAYNLRQLAKGIQPETGELLAPTSVVQTAASIRFLLVLADELDGMPQVAPASAGKVKPARLSEEERMERNLKEGRERRAGFPWSHKDVEAMLEHYRTSRDLKATAKYCERSDYACALKLVDAGLMTVQEVADLGIAKAVPKRGTA